MKDSTDRSFVRVGAGALGIGLAALSAGCAQAPEAMGSATQAIVYGDDHRVELFEMDHDDGAREVGLRAVAAMVPREKIFRAAGRVEVRGPTWAEEQQLCDGVRFAEQPVVASCSAVLVRGDLVLTAGHCARLCSQTSIVFGLYYDAPGVLHDLDETNLYACVDVVVDEVSASGVDYAFLRLDRPVETEVTPAVPRLEPPELGESLTLVSFPGGIPMKGDAGGSVTELRAGTLLTSHDAFAGSSGGPLFDEVGRVVAVLGGGAPDLVATDEGCFEPLVVDAGPLEGAERSTDLDTALRGLCDHGSWEPLCRAHDAANAGESAPPSCAMARRPARAGGTWWVGLLVGCCAFERRYARTRRLVMPQRG